MNRCEKIVDKACEAVDGDKTRMIDILRAVQAECGCVPDPAMERIAGIVGCSRAEVESVVTFYAFLSKEQQGTHVIRLCDDIIDRFHGADEVGAALAGSLGIDFGQTTPDGTFSLRHTPCIGMSDQAPAAMVDEKIVTELTPKAAREMVAALRDGVDPDELFGSGGDGMNADPRIRSMVVNNVRKEGPVIFAPYERCAVATAAADSSADDILRAITDSGLRGRGGAGFPTGMKWGFLAKASAAHKAILCNADEGEPGTFKDRVILTERPDMVFAGMSLAAKATGADIGILYLRGEYSYLKAYLDDVLARWRADGMLGDGFDIRVQMGAGAYVCGEETALISSCEGLRGDPKNRPPFPAQKGYLGMPSNVNNVETYACAARIIERGAAWFRALGTDGTSGTKVLSICGDVAAPGCYEVENGIALAHLLGMSGAEDTAFVCVGGPSGSIVGESGFERRIEYDDLATGGAVLVFDRRRDPLDVASAFMDFFIEESCGFCTPCRAGTVLLKERLDAVRAGKGQRSDIDYLTELGQVVTRTSRCGLGQTASKPVLETLANLRGAYDALLREDSQFVPTFDLAAATGQAADIAGHASVHLDD